MRLAYNAPITKCVLPLPTVILICCRDNIQKLSAESVTRLEDHLKNVQAQYDVGVVAKVDVLRSQVELANAKQTLIQAENAYQVSEANMNKIVGLPMDTNLKLDNLLVYNAYDKTWMTAWLMLPSTVLS